MMSVSVCLSVKEVHWRIIANLGFKFRSDPNLPRNAVAPRCMRATINQSIKIYFLSNRNITVYTVYASAQKAAREAYAH